MVGPGWERLSRVPPCAHLSGWHKPYGPCVVWVQEYPPAGCIISSNCRALGHEHRYRLSPPSDHVLVVEFRCGLWHGWFGWFGRYVVGGLVVMVYSYTLVVYISVLISWLAGFESVVG